MKFGNFNFLEPSGPLQTYNGTALPILFNIKIDFEGISYVKVNWI